MNQPATQTTVTEAHCPECDASVHFERPPLNGEIVHCIDCGVELEVITITPTVLELAPEVEEDWGE